MIIEYDQDGEDETRSLNEFIVDVSERYEIVNVIVTEWMTGYRKEGNTTTQDASKAIVIVK